jgi:DNA repair ATPase RecN
MSIIEDSRVIGSTQVPMIFLISSPQSIEIKELKTAIKTNQTSLSSVLKAAKTLKAEKNVGQEELEHLRTNLKQLRKAKKEYYSTKWLGRIFKAISKRFGSLSETKKCIKDLRDCSQTPPSIANRPNISLPRAISIKA